MANRKLADQNQRWLLMLDDDVRDVQRTISMMLARLDKDSPEVDWDRLDGLLGKVRATCDYARNECKLRAPPK